MTDFIIQIHFGKGSRDQRWNLFAVVHPFNYRRRMLNLFLILQL